MKGDVVDIGFVSPKLLRRMRAEIDPLLAEHRPLRVGIAGESGSGKTVLAHALANAFDQDGLRSAVIQLDDYFRCPPKDTEARRREDLGRVGPDEVDLERLDHDLEQIIEGAGTIEKPVVDYHNNSIGRERLELSGLRLVVVEGTYVGMLQRVDYRIFIDRTYVDTRDARQSRGRELQDDWLESVLEIEHRYVHRHRDLADLVIGEGYEIQQY